jgi:D-3-phosphoglycerate dehydrogenase
MYKYHCLNPIAKVGIDLLSDEYEKSDNFEEAQAVLVRSANIHNLELHESLTAIARAGAGVNNIPLDECAEKGVVVFNTPGANANGVKEMVIAGMLLASRDIVGGINWVSQNEGNDDIAKLTESKKSNFAGNELKGKKIGIVGLGAIGVLVANVAAHLGMTVYGYDPYISVNAAWSLSTEIKHIENIEDIYRECDFITIHVPLLDSTREMIDKESISLMKKEVVILNFARDLLVNEKDVVEALKEERIKKYVTDFPNPTTNGAKGTIVIPHLGASTQESEDNCAIMAVQELREFLENGNIKNSVNYPACDLGACTQACRVAINHRNTNNMIGQFTSVLGTSGFNITNMVNKSKGDYAYTLLDIESVITDGAVEKLQEIEGVLRVRVI